VRFFLFISGAFIGVTLLLNSADIGLAIGDIRSNETVNESIVFSIEIFM